MKLTKHTHATVVLEDAGQSILIDPGTFTPNAADLLVTATAVLITHEHIDHFAIDAIAEALRKRGELRLWGPATATAVLENTGAFQDGRVTTIEGGEVIDIDGIEVRVFGGDHAQIHDGIAVPHNVGYLVGGRVFHPGDSYAVPDVVVDTLLVPTSGPWVKVGDAIDFVDAIKPRRTIQIHDVMLSEIGRKSMGMFLGENGLTGTPMHILVAGETIEA